jgi:hypothetical protein
VADFRRAQVPALREGMMIYTAMGKEVLHNGRHFADVITSEDAELIAKLLNADQATYGKAEAWLKMQNERK